MSAFLGPIHYWLYNKIALQDKMTDAVLELNRENRYVAELEAETDEVCGMLEKKPLEEMIDESNIHGWLQERVNIVEHRFAFAVTQILNQVPEALSAIENCMFETGVQIYSENGESFDSAEGVFKKLNDMLLDGMPCDRVNELVSGSSDEVIYRRTVCIHEKFWTEAGGQAFVYYTLRSQFISGFLSDSAFSYSADEAGNYHILRK